jgi:hypothetical protein
MLEIGSPMALRAMVLQVFFAKQKTLATPLWQSHNSYDFFIAKT